MIRPWPHAGLLWLAAMAATLASCNGRLAAPGDAETAIRPKVRAWTGSGRGPMSDPEPDRTHIAGLTVSIWKPSTGGRGHLPLLIFSHGFHGRGAQSKFLMRAIADDGYLVMAPDHKDAGLGRSARPETPFGNPATWTDSTYRDRADDVRGLLKGLRDDPNWSRAIDWSKVALAGHSLGGYTVLGLAGAWPAWRVSGIKAVLALSPYSMPFQIKGGLSGLDVPVMYQGGTRDAGVTPWIADKRGAFALTSSPAYFVEFKGAGHFAWTDINPKFQESIVHYSLAFLDRYVKGDKSQDLQRKLADVAELRAK